MSRSIWISASLACLVIGAGFLFADDTDTPAKRPAAGTTSPVEKPESRVRILWPTPYPYFDNSPAPALFLQATASGKPESGGYGMIRDGGARFHEGIDIRPEKRDSRGEPADVVTAAMAGRVAYVNPKTDGAYGRYVVLEHTAGGVSLYTLYAHLASIDPALREGRFIAPGATLGVMGRSDAGGGFPKERAHLHFEVGLRLSDNFARWYAARRYPDPNLHGNFNGINLVGLNPLLFFRFARETNGSPTATALAGWVRGQSVAVLADVPARGRPEILRRNPALVAGDNPSATPPGWRVGFTADGVPVRWEPLKISPGALKIVSVDNDQSREARRRGLVVLRKKNAYVPGSTLETALAIAVEN